MGIFFFQGTATTQIYTLSLHDALPISQHQHTPVKTPPPPASHRVLPNQVVCVLLSWGRHRVRDNAFQLAEEMKGRAAVGHVQRLGRCQSSEMVRGRFFPTASPAGDGPGLTAPLECEGVHLN